jgi:predicted phosphodiesterase
MRIQFISDLHLERDPDYCPRGAPQVDVLVLAGDIGSYQPGSRLTSPDFGLERFSPAKAGSPWPRVLFVPGNHEFDSLDFDEAYERLRSTCARLRIDWLESATVTVGGVRFVGTTLWSDFDALASKETTLIAQLRQREKAYRAANYYLSKNTTFREGRPLLADSIRELGLSSQRWLRAALVEPFAGTTVAVTHFAPSLRSADPRYGVNPATAGFCNSLEDLTKFASIWIHGHLHCPNNYVVPHETDGVPHSCRVVSNPRGYSSKGEQDDFVEGLVLEI